MNVYEAGRDDFPGRVDYTRGLDAHTLIDVEDAPVLDRDIGASLRGAGAIDDTTIANESVDVQ